MVFKIDESMHDRLDLLSGVFKKFPGLTGVELEIALPELKKTVTLGVTEPGGVTLSNQFFEDLHGVFGRTDFIEIRG